MILLNDEEIHDLDNKLVEVDEWITETDEHKSFLFSRRYFAEAQLKKVVEWLRKNGEEDVLEDGTDNWYFGIREEDWQSMLKEVE